MPSKTTAMVPACRTIILSILLSATSLAALAGDDKPASKKDAAEVQSEFTAFRNNSRPKNNWGSADRYISETDLAHYATLLDQLKTLDSVGLSKLSLADKFFIISVRRTQSPASIWTMTPKDLAAAALKSGFEHAIYFADITIGTDILIAGTSAGKTKIFKADLLYKELVIEKNAIICIKNDGSFFIPATDIRNQYFSTVVDLEIGLSGLSQEAYLVRMTKKINIPEEHTYVWNPNVGLEYWINNKRKASRMYQAGKLHGTTKEYDSEGNLSAKLEYQDGQYHGLQVRYEYGVLSSESMYDHGDLSIVKSFHANGKISKTVSWKNSKPVTLKTYGETGILEYENTNDHGTYYYPNGKKESEGPTGVFGRSGIWKFYNEAGKVVKEQEYRFGNPYGSAKTYQP